MSLEKINIRNFILILIIVAAAATRFLPLGNLASWFNFTPIGAMALFGGAYFSDKIKAYCIPLITLFVSDLVLNTTIYKNVDGKFDAAVWTYISFLLMVFVGTYIKKVGVRSVILASIAATFIHWIVSDISVVLMAGSMYPKTFGGYLTALVAAIPFERNFLVSNLIFSFLMFGGFELAKMKFPALSFNRNTELQAS